LHAIELIKNIITQIAVFILALEVGLDELNSSRAVALVIEHNTDTE